MAADHDSAHDHGVKARSKAPPAITRTKARGRCWSRWPAVARRDLRRLRSSTTRSSRPSSGADFWSGSVAFNEHLTHAMHEVPVWVKWTPFAVMLIGLAIAYRNYIRDAGRAGGVRRACSRACTAS